MNLTSRRSTTKSFCGNNFKENWLVIDASSELMIDSAISFFNLCTKKKEGAQ